MHPAPGRCQSPESRFHVRSRHSPKRDSFSSQGKNRNSDNLSSYSLQFNRTGSEQNDYHPLSPRNASKQNIRESSPLQSDSRRFHNRRNLSRSPTPLQRTKRLDSGNGINIRKEYKERSLSNDRTRHCKRLSSRERLHRQPSRERLDKQPRRERLDKQPRRKRLSRSPRRNKDKGVERSDKRSLSPEIIQIRQSNNYGCSSEIVTKQNIDCEKYIQNLSPNYERFCGDGFEQNIATTTLR